MIKLIELYSYVQGSPILTINQDSIWLNNLFVEGIEDKYTFPYSRISIDTSINWGKLEGRVTKIQNDIEICKSFDLEKYLSMDSNQNKSKFLLDYLYLQLKDFDFGVSELYWDRAYHHCINNKYQFKKRSKKKNEILKKMKGWSCYLYAEIDIATFKLFIVVEDTINNKSQRQLIATPPRHYFNNFDGYKLKVNADNTIDVWDASYYKDNFKLEGIELDLDI